MQYTDHTRYTAILAEIDALQRALGKAQPWQRDAIERKLTEERGTARTVLACIRADQTR